MCSVREEREFCRCQLGESNFTRISLSCSSLAEIGVRMMSQMDIPEEIRARLMEQLGVSSQHIDDALR